MSNCLLTEVPGGDNEFTAVAGTLTLNLTDVTGNTMLDTIHTSVIDRTNPGAAVAVPFTATVTSLSFVMKPKRIYAIKPTFSQLLDPFTSRAELKESCGQVIDTITVRNLVPGYIVEVA